MKNFVTLMLVILFSLPCSELIGQTNKSKQVIAIHQVDLKENIDSKEFEKFVLSEIAPIYNRMKGQQFTLAKGDRGSRINKYAVILTFDSVEDRNRIYPENGNSSVDWGDDEIWEKLRSMTKDLWSESKFTDYIEISQ